jgi:hypothetical protein
VRNGSVSKLIFAFLNHLREDGILKLLSTAIEGNHVSFNYIPPLDYLTKTLLDIFYVSFFDHEFAQKFPDVGFFRYYDIVYLPKTSCSNDNAQTNDYAITYSNDNIDMREVYALLDGILENFPYVIAGHKIEYTESGGYPIKYGDSYIISIEDDGDTVISSGYEEFTN